MQDSFASFDGVMDGVKAFFASIIGPLSDFFNIFSNIWVGTILISIIFIIGLAFSIRRDGKEFKSIIKKPKTVAFCAVMIAINAVLGLYTPVLSSYLKIEFGFVTLPVVAMLFGPVTACCMGMVQDIVGLIMKPTGSLLIALTLTDGITGMIYSAFFYKKRVTFLRVFLAQLIIVTAVNIVLNSIALAPTVASGLVGILPSRVVKNIILLPIQSVIAYAILKAVDARKTGVSVNDKQDYKP